MDESEQASLRCSQLFANCAGPKVVIAVTAKAQEALAASVDKRLTPGLVHVYSSNYAPLGEVMPGEAPTDSRGMQLFTQLREHQQKLQATRPWP